MATLTRDEARRERARKHARRSWACPLCGRACLGNGGKSSHKRMHLRKAGYPDGCDWGYFMRERDRELSQLGGFQKDGE
jgi:hypothetical protein